MLGVEAIRKVRLALAKGESIHSIAEKYRMGRNTVRKIVRTGQTKFTYSKRAPRYPVLGPHIQRLGEILEQEMELLSKERRTGKNIYEQLQREGYKGGYDAVLRYIKRWAQTRS
jgi:transposase